MSPNSAPRGLDRVRNSIGGVLHSFRWVFLVVLAALAAGGVGFLIGYLLAG